MRAARVGGQDRPTNACSSRAATRAATRASALAAGRERVSTLWGATPATRDGSSGAHRRTPLTTRKNERIRRPHRPWRCRPALSAGRRAGARTSPARRRFRTSPRPSPGSS
jgi:hypothetical protein